MSDVVLSFFDIFKTLKTEHTFLNMFFNSTSLDLLNTLYVWFVCLCEFVCEFRFV